MTEALTTFITDAGWLAPLYYVGSFVLTALLPFIPTPLVGALGGSAFGFVPAVAYGVIGLGAGTVVALGLSRRIGRPLLVRLVRPAVWAEWEKLLGIESVAIWGVIFFVLNLDVAVVAAGLTPLPLWQLWVAAMVARIPWLIVSAWFGDAVLVSDGVALLVLLLLVPVLIGLNKLRPLVRGWLQRVADRSGRAPGP